MTRVSNKEPLISVIVPVYKVEEYLNKCVESIINQTYKNLEIILVDDGSPDNCPKMCDEWSKKDKRIKVIHKENGGVSSARNIGLDNCSGKYISFVDSDDWLELNYFEDMLMIINKYKVKYVTCGYTRIYDNRKEVINGDLIEKKITSKEYLNQLLNVGNSYGFVHMKLIEKKVIDNNRFNESLIVGEDALFNITLCNNLDDVVIYNKPLYNYFFNSNSVVRKYNDNYCNNYYNSMAYMNEYIRSTYSEKNIITNLYNYIAYHVLLICVNYCYHPDNPNRGLKLLKKICNIDLFKEAIKNSNYNGLGITRKISLFSLKHKLYIIMSLICKIRQRQFRK